MVDALCMDFLSASPAINQVNGFSSNILGGVLHREGTQDALKGVFEARNSIITKNQNDVFCIHNMRIYKFRSDVFHIPVSTYSTTQAAFNNFATGDSWTTPLASGTFAENGIATDGFVQLIVVTGIVSLGDVITIGSGAAIGETATATANQSQGGATGSTGEWIIVYQILTTPKASYSHTGLFPVSIDNELGLVGLFISSTNFIHAITYTSTTGWIESSAINSTTSTTIDCFGVGSVVGDSVGFPISDTAGIFITYLYNPSNGIGSISSLSGTGWSGFGGLFSNNSRLTMWRGEIYTFHQVLNSPFLEQHLLKLVGGAWIDVYNTSVLISGTLNAFGPASGDPGKQLFTNNGNLYSFGTGQNNFNSSGNFGIILNRFYLDAGIVKSDTFDNLPVPDSLFAKDMLGAAIGQSPNPAVGTSFAPAMMRFVQDNDTNSPDGIQRTFCYLALLGVGAANSMTTYLFEGFKQVVDATYTWNGTSTIIVSSGTSAIAVGSWVQPIKDPTAPSFRVISVGPTTITISNINSIPIPVGIGMYAIPVGGFVSQGSASAITRFAFPSRMTSGSANSFTKGQNTISTILNAKASGARLLTFKPEGGGTRVVRVYYGLGQNLKATALAPLQNASAGTIVAEGSGHKITGIVADGTLLTVEIPFAAAGIVSGDVRKIVPRISST